ncbi:dienelactone hydrolase family protein [Robertkochia aurantiaca]|uniref:dienelactone hydrolase family protein n=1 Tax=Robertkochia aurantiaca TaxID=2873700 RepID=UPI001CCDAE92|nr:dienelactone hydrolase family protein [Robertkochia sp. 3YJGBD-33]
MKPTFTLLLVTLLFTFSCKQESKKQEEPKEKSSMASAESDQLSQSPRHHEWIDLERENGTFKAFVVYPETDQPAKAAVVIHENRGLNDWARSFADQLAAKGYLVIAPDLISNTVEGIEKTTDFENSDKAREAIYALDPDQVTKDLNAAYNYIKNDPASSGTVFVIGFCWGGSQTFRYATNNDDIKEALVFYGTAPDDKSELQTIKCPVYGFYGGDDNRVNSTIPATEEAMKEFGLTYEYVIYEGAGHAFMRRGAQSDAEPANKEAHDKAWDRLLSILKPE